VTSSDVCAEEGTRTSEEHCARLALMTDAYLRRELVLMSALGSSLLTELFQEMNLPTDLRIQTDREGIPRRGRGEADKNSG